MLHKLSRRLSNGARGHELRKGRTATPGLDVNVGFTMAKPFAAKVTFLELVAAKCPIRFTR